MRGIPKTTQNIQPTMNRNRRSYGTTVARQAITSAADNLIRDERKYKFNIQESHVKNIVLAEHLKHGTIPSNSTTGSSNDNITSNTITATVHPSKNVTATIAALLLEDSSGENAEFVADLSEEVKSIARQHVQQMRDVDVFVEAVRSVANEFELNHRERQGNENDDFELDVVDYEALINQKISVIASRKQSEYIDVEEEQLYRDVLKCLGEKKKRNRENGDEDEEEELEMLSDDEQNLDDVEKKLKCPITTALMEDAVKNKVCGHVYSRVGVQGMFRSRNFKCPMPGCSNRRITQDQLEDDLQIQEKVKKFKRRRQRYLQSQADDEDDYEVVE